LDDLAGRTKIFVSLDTLKYMIRQGRISKMKGLAAKVMNMKPIISLAKDGSGMIQDKAFSLKGTEKKILGLLAKRKMLSYAVVHAGAEDRAENLVKQIRTKFGMDPEYVSTISPIVAMNAGIGAVAVAAIFENWED
jgi:DegV family protein with EDD domain